MNLKYTLSCFVMTVAFCGTPLVSADTGVTVFEITHAHNIEGDIKFHVTEHSHEKRIQVFSHGTVLRGELIIRGADIQPIGEHAIKIATSKEGVFSTVVFTDIGIRFLVTLTGSLPFDGKKNEKMQIITIGTVEDGETIFFINTVDFNNDGRIDVISIAVEDPVGITFGLALDVLDGKKEIGDIDMFSYSHCLMRIKPETWNKHHLRTESTSVTIKSLRTSTDGENNEEKKSLGYFLPYELPIRAGYLDDENYSSLIAASMENYRVGKTNAPVSKILKSISTNLLTAAESPLESFGTRDAVFRIGGTLIACLTGDRSSANASSKDYDQIPQHAYDTVRWIITGLRKEPTLGCQRYAIRAETDLMNHYKSKSRINHAFVSLFEERHLQETGRIFNRNIRELSRIAKVAVKENKNKGINAITKEVGLNLGRDVESCKTFEELKDLLTQAHNFASILKNGDEFSCCSHVRHLVESFLIPDLELHLMKYEFEKCGGCEPSKR